MPNNDRDRRLLDASVLHAAINALSKVEEEQRIEFVHDRMMSAIDDICKTHPKAFTGPQIAILKDVSFQLIYILDTRNRPPKSFLKRLFEEFRNQSPMKQIGISFSVLKVLFAAGVSVVNSFDTWGLPALQYLHLVSKPSSEPLSQIQMSQKPVTAGSESVGSKISPSRPTSRD
jgi:hypothetical protein